MSRSQTNLHASFVPSTSSWLFTLVIYRLVVGGEDEEVMMGIPDNLVTGYRAGYPGLFPRGEDLIAIEAKAQGTQKPAKRRSPQVQTTSSNKKRCR